MALAEHRSTYSAFPRCSERIRRSIGSYVFFVYMGIDIALVLYTIYYYSIRGDFVSFLPCTSLLVGPLICMFNMSCSIFGVDFDIVYWNQWFFKSSPMGYNAITFPHSSMFHSLVDFGGKYIHPNKKPDDEYSKICSKQIDKTVRVFT